MGMSVLGESESGRQVLLQVLDLRDASNQSSVHLLLHSLLFFGQSALLLLALEEFVTALLGGGGLVLLEEGVGHLGHIGLGGIDLSAGGNDVALVHAAQRHTVDLEGTADKQEARLQLFQENNALALEATGQ